MPGFKSCLLTLACYSLVACHGRHDTRSSTADGKDAAEQQVVNLYFWSDYLAPDTLSSFEKRTGIKVNVAYFDSYESLEAKIMAGHSGFDVVLPANGTIRREIRSGAFLPLDKAKLPNLAGLDPKATAMVALSDPGNAFGVPYMWSTYGIGFNKKAAALRMPNATIDSWRVLFDPAQAAKFASCGINVIDDPVGVVSIVLKYLGRDPNAPRAQDLLDAEKLLLAIRPHVRNIDTSGEIEAVANGDICVSLGYSGDFVQADKRARAAKNGIEIDYVVPREGSLVGFDILAIPKDAPHPENAYRLINYLIDAHVAADISNYIGFANGSQAATPFLDPAIASNEFIYPTAVQQQRLFVQPEASPEMSRAITRIWQRFRTGQ